MGRVPARCVVLLEDLDAAFVRSVSRDDDDQEEEKKEGPQQQNQEGGSGGSGGSGRRRRGRGGEQMSDVNTLSLSGLLNALDGVAAAEGRLLFALVNLYFLSTEAYFPLLCSTTNHLERLDPALSRPGRMDVWIEFKNASKWQAEALFRNFFPCAEEEEEADEQQLKSINVDIEVEPSSPPSTPRKFVPIPSNSAVTPTSLWSLSSSLASSASSLLASPPMSPSPLGSGSGTNTPPPPRTQVGTPSSNGTSSSSTLVAAAPIDKNQFGATNTAYLPPPPTASVLNTKHSAAPLDTRTLAILAKRFADGVPEEEFSVAALQGCESPFLFLCLWFVGWDIC
jgi:chaperone BCS1